MTAGVVACSGFGLSGTPGSAVTVVSGGIYTSGFALLRVAVLSSTSVIACYKDPSTQYGMAVVITSIGGVPVIGTPFTFYAGVVSNMVVGALSSTSAVIAFTGSFVIVTGLTTTPVVSSIFSSGIQPKDIAVITSTKALLVHESANVISAQNLINLGTTPSATSSVTIASSVLINGADTVSLALGSTTVAAVLYSPSSPDTTYFITQINTGGASAVAPTISSTSTITTGAGSNNGISLAALDTGNAAMVYPSSSNLLARYITGVNGTLNYSASPFTVLAGTSGNIGIKSAAIDAANILQISQGKGRILANVPGASSNAPLGSFGTNAGVTPVILSLSLGAIFYIDDADSNKLKFKALT